MINNSCTPAVFFWWPDSLQLPSNPVSVCLPGVFWLDAKKPGGRHRVTLTVKDLRIFLHRQATNGREFQQIRDRSWKERDSRAKRNLRSWGHFFELWNSVFAVRNLYDQRKNVSSNMVKHQWSWLWLVTKQNMTCWYWSILEPLTCCLWVCEGARNIYKAQINIDSEW